MEEKYKTNVSVCLLAIDPNNQVLLTRRYNTGYQDGKYEFPSGHIEKGETAIEGVEREAKQENDITIDVDSTEYVGCVDNNKTGKHFNLLFKCSSITGEAKIMEPEECDDLIYINYYDLLNGIMAEQMSTDTLRFLVMLKEERQFISFTGEENLIERLKGISI